MKGTTELPAVHSTHAQRKKIISLTISLGTYNTVLDDIMDAAHRQESRTVCCANVHMTIEARHKPDFARIVNGADWVVPDGVPLLWALRLLYGIKQGQLTGLDMLPDLLERAAKESLPVFFYGSTEKVLQRTVDECHLRYQGLQIAGSYSPPFRELTEAEDASVAKLITTSGAKMVFVSLGCPKQEIWVSRMRGRIPAVLLAIGGALPVFAGEISRAPKLMQKTGMEWTFRLIKEPRRLFKRHAYTNSFYFYHLINQLMTN